MCSAPRGIRAMRLRASVNSISRSSVVGREQFKSLRVVLARHAEGLGDRVGGDVVMRRPDAAGGEQIGIALSQRIDGLGDVILIVGNDADLLEVDTDRRHDVGEMADIAILGAAGKDFVADDEHRRGNGFSHRALLELRSVQIARAGQAGNVH